MAPHSLSQGPFRCPLRWVLVSGKQKGQSEAQLVIKREMGVSPATDSQTSKAPIRHFLFVYAGNKPEPEVSLNLDLISPTLDSSSVTFRYFIASKRMIFDCPVENEQPAKVVDIYFTDSLSLQKTVSILSDLGVQCQSCGGTLPAAARSQSSTGYPQQRSMLDPSPTPPILSPDMFRNTHAFSPPLVIQSPEGRVTPVQIRRVGKRRVPTPVAPIPDPRLQAQSPIPRVHSVPEGVGGAFRRISIPVALRVPIEPHGAVEASASACFPPSRLPTPSISDTTLESAHRNDGRGSNSERKFLRPRISWDETGWQAVDDSYIDFEPPSQTSSPYFPAARSANRSPPSSSLIGTATTDRLPKSRVKNASSSTETIPQVSRSTQYDTTYTHAQAQAGDGDVSKLPISDDSSPRLLDVIDLWDNMRLKLQEAVDETKPDDAALGTLILTYQGDLERSLGRLIP